MGIPHTTLIAGLIAVQASGVAAQDRWAGYYGGLSIDALDSTAEVPGNARLSFRDKTANLGLYAGYNFVRGNGFVWGPEVSLTSVSTDGSATDATLGTANFDGGVLLSPRVRAGFATDRVYYYGILGLGMTNAFARPEGNTDTNVVISPSIGIGAEFVVGDGWSTKIEAVHHKFESPEYDFNGTTSRSDTDITQITIGLTRKF